jgi:hypothetical protein
MMNMEDENVIVLFASVDKLFKHSYLSQLIANEKQMIGM